MDNDTNNITKYPSLSVAAPKTVPEIKTLIPGKASPVSELLTYPDILPVLAENKYENKRIDIEKYLILIFNILDKVLDSIILTDI